MVQIVTDSCADFEPEELKRMNVTCVPISVNFGGVTYKENADLSKEMFYSLLKSKREFPQTAQPPPYEFESVFNSFKNNENDTIAILMSSALSGLYCNALMAKENSKYDNCCIFDSLNASAGERIMVEYAVHLRNKGKTAREIINALEELRPRIRLYACADSLEYLYKGGRISGLTAAIGTVTQIKPILRMLPDGKVDVPFRALGKQRGISYILKKVEEVKPDPKFPIYVMYSQNRNVGVSFTERLRGIGYKIPDSRIVNAGAAIGSHTGPNAFGTAYVAAK